MRFRSASRRCVARCKTTAGSGDCWARLTGAEARTKAIRADLRCAWIMCGTQAARKRQLLLGRCYQPHVQAGFIAGGRVLVDYTLLHGLIDHGDSVGEQRLSLSGISRLQGLPELPQLGAKTGCISAILRGTFYGLTGALERRKMICHVLLCPLWISFRIAEVLILLGAPVNGQSQANLL